MNDIIPPQRPKPLPNAQAPPTPPVEAPAEPPVPPAAEAVSAPVRPKRRWLLGVAGIIGAVLVAIMIGGVWWWNQQLQAVTPGSAQRVRLTIASGQTLSMIAASLEEKDIIRNQAVFTWYARLTGQDDLQAGAYRLSKGDDMKKIIAQLTSGKTDVFTITFLPGATLAENRAVLEKAGYSDQAIDEGLTAPYQSAAFAGKPKGSDLEGFIYGETYQFPADATPEQIVTRALDQLEGVVKENNLEALYKKHGLTLYEGITLASIIQREVVTPADQKQVAQVFYLRLKHHMSLGSDVTYQYAAKKMGVAPDPGLESPYNTRIHPGLPPGPIATPGLSALLAVAHPAKGDYLYFLSGDDDKTYFAKTNAQHEKNIVDHCKVKCATP